MYYFFYFCTGVRDSNSRAFTRAGPRPPDAAYQALKADMLSTSSLYSDAIMLGGFGPVSPGYGVGYAASPDLSLFHITSWGRSARGGPPGHQPHASNKKHVPKNVPLAYSAEGQFFGASLKRV